MYSELQPIATRLPQVSSFEAATARLLGDARLRAQLAQWLPGLTQWRTETLGEALPSERRFGFVFTGPHGEIAVTVPDTLSGALTATMTATDWPEPLRMACIARLMDATVEPVAAWLKRHGFSLTSAGRDFAVPDGEQVVSFLLGTDQVCAWVRCTDRAWLSRAPAGLAGLPTGALASVGQLSVALAVTFGRRRMSTSLLRTLAAGDVLVLPLGAAPAGSIERAFLVTGRRGTSRLGLVCQVLGGQLTIQGDNWMSDSHDMPAETGTTAQRPGEADPLAEIDVDLHLELQVVSTPLSELANMRRGYVLELPTTVQDAGVDLVVGGQLFGRAQLVCVGDRLGARIIELRHDAD
jgi:type III secretion system YscQ/HrcQ family protein